MNKKTRSLKLIVMSVLLISIFIIGGCSNNKNNESTEKEGTKQTEKEKTDGTKIVVDTTGKEVKMPSDVKSIAAVPIPWASIIYAVDGNGKRISGMHPSAKKSYEKSILNDMAPELKNASTNFVDNDFTIHMEEAKKLNPDAMIIWDYQEAEIEQLKNIGIPGIALKYGTLKDLQNGIKVIGDVLDKQDQASKLIEYHKETEEYFTSVKDKYEQSKKPRVLYLRDEELKVAGSKSANNAFIEMSGGDNVSKDTPGQWVNVTMEQIIEWNPEIIYLSNFSDFKPEDILENKIEGQDWSKIDAVKNNKVYKTPMGIYRWDAPCAETPIMIKWMATVQQPEIFNKLDIKKELKDFYTKFLNYNLKEDEINRILNMK